MVTTHKSADKMSVVGLAGFEPAISCSQSNGVEIINQTGTQFQNIVVKNGTIQNFGQDISIDGDASNGNNVSQTTIRDMTITGDNGTGQTGVHLGAGCSETTVSNCNFSALGYGIWCLNFGDGDTFRGNVFKNLYKFGGAIIVSTIFGQVHGKEINCSVNNLAPSPINPD